ncbi:MAG: acyl-CoA dehydrogenase family protein, partial [Planctomycetota bacterium]
MSVYKPPDFYQIDDLLTDEQRLIAQTVRRFVDGEVMPIIAHHNREGTFPVHLLPQMGELGLLGANLDGYGCTDLGPVGYGLINQELERG